jgi:hypothetical protein
MISTSGQLSAISDQPDQSGSWSALDFWLTAES